MLFRSLFVLKCELDCSISVAQWRNCELACSLL